MAGLFEHLDNICRYVSEKTDDLAQKISEEMAVQKIQSQIREEDREISARFFYHELKHWGELPVHAPGWLCEDVARRHLYSPSMLCILTWQDWTAMDETLRNPDIDIERINVPSIPKHYWRWRMHVTLEYLMQQTEFNNKVRQMIDESGRY